MICKADKHETISKNDEYDFFFFLLCIHHRFHIFSFNTFGMHNVVDNNLKLCEEGFVAEWCAIHNK